MTRQERRKETIKSAICGAISIIAFVLIWEVVVRAGLVSDKLLAPPSEVVETFFDKWTNVRPEGSTLGTHILVSLRLALTGFAAAVVIGVPMGLIMGYSKVGSAILTPIFEVIRPIPPLAWIPVILLVLGIGMTAKAFIIFVAAFVPCVINSYTGIRRTNPVLINVAKTSGASRWQIFFKVGLPSAIPMIFTGIKISLGTAWGCLVAAEMLASSQGLGYMIQRARTLARPDIIILGMLLIGLIGAVLTAILTAIENKIAPWRKTR